MHQLCRNLPVNLCDLRLQRRNLRLEEPLLVSTLYVLVLYVDERTPHSTDHESNDQETEQSSELYLIIVPVSRSFHAASPALRLAISRYEPADFSSPLLRTGVAPSALPTESADQD